jgi:hypothetical protein
MTGSSEYTLCPETDDLVTLVGLLVTTTPIMERLATTCLLVIYKRSNGATSISISISNSTSNGLEDCWCDQVLCGRQHCLVARFKAASQDLLS